MVVNPQGALRVGKDAAATQVKTNLEVEIGGGVKHGNGGMVIAAGCEGVRGGMRAGRC